MLVSNCSTGTSRELWWVHLSLLAAGKPAEALFSAWALLRLPSAVVIAEGGKDGVSIVVYGTKDAAAGDHSKGEEV